MSEMFYYGVTNPSDPLSCEITHRNRKELRFWHAQLPDDDEDLATSILKINLRTGVPRKFIAASLFTVRFLKKLPFLSALADKLGHLDMPRLNTVTRALCKVPSQFLELFDEQLAAYLTPTRQNQVLPQPASIAAMSRRLKDKLLPPEPEEEPASQHTTVSFSKGGKGVRLSAWIPEDQAALIDVAIKQVAKTQDLLPSQALSELLMSNITTEVTLHAYGSATKPEYLQNGGWLTPQQIDYWKTKVTMHCDMDGIACAETSSYSPTYEMKAFVRGRDSECRVPGCTVKAVNCQIDHIIPFDRGGPTTPWNLQCLCVFHHNMKTDGRLDAVPLPDGDVLFVIDGLPFRSVPDGPLSRSNQTWGTKFGDYMDRKVAA